MKTRIIFLVSLTLFFTSTPKAEDQPSTAEQTIVELQAENARLKQELNAAKAAETKSLGAAQLSTAAIAATPMPSTAAPVTSFTDEELHKAFQNQAAFYGKYTGQKIQIRTKVQEIRVDTVILGDYSYFIYCYFDAAEGATIESLRPRQEVTVTGVLIQHPAQAYAVHMRSCVFEGKKRQ